MRKLNLGEKKTNEMQDKNDIIQESWIVEGENGLNEIFLTKKQIWEWINEWRCKQKKKKADDKKFFRCVCKPQNAKSHPRMRN